MDIDKAFVDLVNAIKERNTARRRLEEANKAVKIAVLNAYDAEMPMKDLVGMTGLSSQRIHQMMNEVRMIVRADVERQRVLDWQASLTSSTNLDELESS